MCYQPMDRSIFIAIEGTDGSGKSSQAKLLAAGLEAAGHKVYTTFEPTDGTIGKMVRSILKGSIKADERTIAALFLADRMDHLLNETNGIVKKLQEGYTVISDRYYFSSYAYHGTHTDIDWVIACNKMCAHILRPDINIFIDVPTEECMKRIKENRNNTELYETAENLDKVRAKYFEAFEKLQDEENIVLVNGNRPMNVVANDVMAEVKRYWLRLHT